MSAPSRAPGLAAVDIRAKHSYAYPPEDPREGDDLLGFFPVAKRSD